MGAGEGADLLLRIRALPGVAKVTELKPPFFYKRQFEIDVVQPTDHQKPDGPTFTQRVYLSHMSETQPMVFAPSGTRVFPKTIQEISWLLKANNLAVTHRYWEGSKPEPLDYRYLTIRQSAADHHRIVTLFKTIYSGPWLSSGLSKSGMTALFHRRFYPDDVQAVIAKGAPIMTEVGDPRFETFWENVGDQATRKKLKQFQRTALEHREQLIPMVKAYFRSQKEGTFSINPATAFEYHVIEHYFHYWADYRKAKPIPGPGADVKEIFDHLNAVADLKAWSDEGLAWYSPSVYQQLTETGSPGNPRCTWVHLQDLLAEVKEPDPAFYLPKGLTQPVAFKPGVMRDMLRWLQTKGNNIIYIYGSLDPWIAAAVELTGKTNALKIVQPGADHRLRIFQLDQKQSVYDRLEQWLGVKMKREVRK